MTAGSQGRGSHPARMHPAPSGAGGCPVRGTAAGPTRCKPAPPGPGKPRGLPGRLRTVPPAPPSPDPARWRSRTGSGSGRPSEKDPRSPRHRRPGARAGPPARGLPRSPPRSGVSLRRRPHRPEHPSCRAGKAGGAPGPAAAGNGAERGRGSRGGSGRGKRGAPPGPGPGNRRSAATAAAPPRRCGNRSPDEERAGPQHRPGALRGSTESPVPPGHGSPLVPCRRTGQPGRSRDPGASGGRAARPRQPPRRPHRPSNRSPPAAGTAAQSRVYGDRRPGGAGGGPARSWPRDCGQRRPSGVLAAVPSSGDECPSVPSPERRLAAAARSPAARPPRESTAAVSGPGPAGGGRQPPAQDSGAGNRRLPGS